MTLKERLDTIIRSIVGIGPEEDFSIVVPFFYKKLSIPVIKRKVTTERNIVRLENDIRQKVIDVMDNAMEEFQAEWSDLYNKSLRLDVKFRINGIMSGIYEKQQIYSYRVVCDNTNNPPEIYENNFLVVNIYIKWDKESKEKKYTFMVEKR